MISRAGRVPTGVDRVEFAYLNRLSDDPIPCFAIARTTLGYILLNQTGARAIVARISGQAEWGQPDLLSRLARSKPDTVRAAESDLRRLALARCRPQGLARMLRRHLEPGYAYLNTGHSNLTTRMMSAVKAGQGQISVLVHDAIPLDFPHYQRPGTPARFAAILARVQRSADLLIYNSADTQSRVRSWMARDGESPPGIVAHLGVSPPRPNPKALPADLMLDTPYFVTVGTIEPRKRHDILLDAWEVLARDPDIETLPRLYICGTRGWRNSEVFDRLDALPDHGPVQELSRLDDGAVAALTQGAEALLFPSEAEGFGLPPVEAAQLGVPVVCLDLPVYREILGDIPVYEPALDHYKWSKTIKHLIMARAQGTTAKPKRFVPESWDAHFNIVLRLT